MATTEGSEAPTAPAAEEKAEAPTPAETPAADAPATAPAEAAATSSAPRPVTTTAQMAALYVGDLHPEVTEVLLYETFTAAGNVASCRVCRDNVTRRSLGYAYVNYFNLADAEKALETLNYTQIKGRSIRIMWSQRDPTARKNTASNLFVKHLDPAIDNKILYDTFSEYGKILSCKVATDHMGKSKGYGFVHFESEDAAKKATESLNGKQLHSQEVYVGAFLTRQELLASNMENFTNLYVKHLPQEWDEKKVQEVFSEFGELQSAVMQETGDGKRFALVNFTTSEAAKKAVETMHRKDMRPPEAQKEGSTEKDSAKADEPSPADEGAPKPAAEAAEGGEKAEAGEEGEKKEGGDESGEAGKEEPAAAAGDGEGEDFPEYLLYVQRAQTREERSAALRDKPKRDNRAEGGKGSGKGKAGGAERGTKLAIKNLPEGITVEKLRELFQSYGTVTSVMIKPDEVDEGGMSIGHVVLSSTEDASKAVEEMNDREVEGKKLNVSIVERRRRNERAGDGGERRKGGRDGKGKGKGGGGKAGLQGGAPRPGMPHAMPGAGPPCAMPPYMGSGMPAGMMRPPMPGVPGMPTMTAMPTAGGRPLAYSLPTTYPSGGKGAQVAMAPGNAMPGPPNMAYPSRPAYTSVQAMQQAMQVQMVMAAAAMGGRGMPAPQQAPQGAAVPGAAPQQPQQQAPQGQAPTGVPGVAQPPPVAGMPQPCGVPVAQGPPSVEALSSLPPAVQKQVLGERLFPLVQRRHPNLAGKITGMLLELPNSDLVAMLKSESALNRKADEAVTVLEKQKN